MSLATWINFVALDLEQQEVAGNESAQLIAELAERNVFIKSLEFDIKIFQAEVPDLKLDLERIQSLLFIPDPVCYSVPLL